MKSQKERSTSKTKLKYHEWINIDENGKSEFVGYDKSESQMNLIRYREVETENGLNFHLVFDNTPFYGESGGQVGDTGLIKFDNNSIPIVDTIKKYTKDKNELSELSNLLNDEDNKRGASGGNVQINFNGRGLI